MTRKKVPKFIGENIRKRRKDKGFASAAAMAKRLKICQDTIYQLEQGKHTTDGNAVKICRFLNINLHNDIEMHEKRIREGTRLIVEIMEKGEESGKLALSLLRTLHKNMMHK